MDHGEIYIRIEQMREAATAIGRSSSTIQDAIDAVDREVRALGADRFMSIGAEAFRAEYNRVTPQLRESFEQLRQFQEKLNVSADDIELAAKSMR